MKALNELDIMTHLLPLSCHLQSCHFSDSASHQKDSIDYQGTILHPFDLKDLAGIWLKYSFWLTSDSLWILMLLWLLCCWSEVWSRDWILLLSDFLTSVKVISLGYSEGLCMQTWRGLVDCQFLDAAVGAQQTPIGLTTSCCCITISVQYRQGDHTVLKNLIKE